MAYFQKYEDKIQVISQLFDSRASETQSTLSSHWISFYWQFCNFHIHGRVFFSLFDWNIVEIISKWMQKKMEFSSNTKKNNIILSIKLFLNPSYTFFLQCNVNNSWHLRIKTIIMIKTKNDKWIWYCMTVYIFTILSSWNSHAVFGSEKKNFFFKLDTSFLHLLIKWNQEKNISILNIADDILFVTSSDSSVLFFVHHVERIKWMIQAKKKKMIQFDANNKRIMSIWYYYFLNLLLNPAKSMKTIERNVSFNELSKIMIFIVMLSSLPSPYWDRRSFYF